MKPLLATAALVLLIAAPADARSLTIRQTGSPQLTLTVPAGWHAREAKRVLVLTRGSQRVTVRQCPLDRGQRDMTGRRAARARKAATPVAGGSCAIVAGDGAPRLRMRLGPRKAAAASNGEAERIARAARRRTLDEPHAQGTAFAIPFSPVRVDSTWDWNLPAGYSHQIQRYRSGSADLSVEVVHRPDDDFLRGYDDPECWSGASRPDEDDALEPRLELREWDAPPSTATAWRVAYAPPEPLPDGATRVRWTGFVADGEAVVGADGRLRSIRIDDHHQARGRSTWRTVQIDFTAFSAAIAPVVPEPACD